VTTTYDYDNAGQPSQFTVGGAVHGPYSYNGFRQLASREVTAGQPASRIDMIYDLDGNLLAEADSNGVVQRVSSALLAEHAARECPTFHVSGASSP
jgi:hypothetical protein